MSTFEEQRQRLADAVSNVGTAPVVAGNRRRRGWMSKAGAHYKAVQEAADKYDLPEALLAGLIMQESGFRSDAKNPSGATGYTQLMPATAASLGVNPDNPEENIMGGAKYLRQMLDMFNGNVDLALAAYNAGPGNVQKYGNKIPPFNETRAYVRRVKVYARMWGWNGDSKDNGDVFEATGDVAGDTVEAVTSGIDALANSIEDVVGAIFNPATYLRAGKGILGVLLLLLGAWALFSAYGGKVPIGPKVPVPK